MVVNDEFDYKPVLPHLDQDLESSACLVSMAPLSSASPQVSQGLSVYDQPTPSEVVRQVCVHPVLSGTGDTKQESY